MDGEKESTPTLEHNDKIVALDIGRNIFRERFFFFLLLAILILLSLLLIWPNLNEILASLAFVVILNPLYDWYLKKKWIQEKKNRATLLTILTFIFLIAIPVIWVLWIAFNQANSLFTNPGAGNSYTPESMVEGIRELVTDITTDRPDDFDWAFLVEQLRNIGATLADWLTNLVSIIASFLANFFVSSIIVLVIIIVVLPQFKIPDRDQLAVLIPFPPDITELYLEKIQLMIVAMFRGTFLLAFIQGLAMGLVLLIAGVPYVFFLTILSMFLSLLPMIGISLIAWPIGILLILSGQLWQGIFVIAAFLLIVANLDIAFRPILVPRGAYLNPALVMLSVFGGLSLMGMIGIIYGPVIMILLVTSVEVYAKYIMRSDLEPFLAEDGSLNLEKLGLRAASSNSEEESGGSALAILQQLSSRIFRQNGE